MRDLLAKKGVGLSPNELILSDDPNFRSGPVHPAREAEERAGNEALLSAVLSALSRPDAKETAIRELVGHARQHLAADGCAFYWTPSRDAREPVLSGAAPKLSQAEVFDLLNFVTESDRTDNADACPEAVIVEANDSDWVRPVTRRCDGERVGALVLRFDAFRRPSDEERAALTELSECVAHAASVIADKHRLADVEGRFASLARSIPGVIYQRIVEPTGEIYYQYMSESSIELFGVSSDEIMRNPKALFGSFAPEYAASFRERLIEASRNLTTWDVEASILMPDGSKKYTHAIAKPERREDGSVLWTGVILDASRIKKEAERASAETEARTRTEIIESLGHGFLMFDPSDRLVMSNSYILRLYPELKGRLSEGSSYSTFVRHEIRRRLDDSVSEEELNALVRERLDLHREQDAFTLEYKLDTDVWVQISERRTEDGGTVVIHTDISENRRREKRIEHMALHDALTELPNRVLFENRTELARVQALRTGDCYAILYINLDSFKVVNDALGHAVGDQLLRLVAKRLLRTVRESDTVARTGGDEFAVLLPNVDGRSQAEIAAQRIISTLSTPFNVNGQRAKIGASVGIAIGDDNTADAASILRDAGLALNCAKSNGKSVFRVFSKEMDEHSRSRQQLEVDLASAIENEEIDLYFQPQVCLSTMEVTGFEALIRWSHKDRGFISPAEFIPLAEETGLIIPLGDQVIEAAARVASTWKKPLRVAVNLSPAQFNRRGLADFISQTLKKTGLAPERLELEVTESLLMDSTEEAIEALFQLKGLGAAIAMDDFGTGYSSLGNLRSFPFDKIKIDKSFVLGLEEDPGSAAIVGAIVNLGKSLGLRTTAEGVETAAQLDFVAAEGCSEFQGFLCSQALPESKIDAFITGEQAFFSAGKP